MLVWQVQAGADSALGEVPQNWLDRPAIAQATNLAEVPRAPVRPISGANAPPPAPAARAAGPVIADTEGALSEARALASAAGDLEALRAALEKFDGCTLKQSANGLVFADGNPEADIMLIGEAPGREEDIQGVPFVGRSGQLLDRILASIGLDRTKVYIANTVPWRPPGNRTPSPMETQICRPFIERQVELVAPKIVVTLGGAAAKQILGVTTGILRLRGQVSDLPPVVTITSISGIATHAITCAAILVASSGTIARPPSRCPSPSNSVTSVSPDPSSASVRVSETVNTAIVSGTKSTEVSILIHSSPAIIACNFCISCHTSFFCAGCRNR